MDGQLELSLSAPRRVALSVTQLVRTVREALELHLDEYWVVGEISNARVAPSNHFYFTLKDARSAVNVVMFNAAFRRLRFRVNDGMKVVVRGRVSLYEARGTLQFYAEEMEPRGLGALQLAFEQLKQRLGKEGLFDPAHKRALPFLPRTVGIVTALGGAGLRDMLRILLERYPGIHVIVRPALVQGAGAAAEIDAAMRLKVEDSRRSLREISARLRTPAALVRERRLLLSRFDDRLTAAMDSALALRRRQLAEAVGRLDSLSPLKVLERGYAVVVNARNGHAVIDAAAVDLGDDLDIRLNRGRLRARTTARET